MKPKYTFEIFEQTKPRKETLWYWRCRHRNGKIVADGAEGYSSKAKLRRSLCRFLDAMASGPPDCEIKEVA